jgi:iron complex transport system substrate-binding protein
MKHSIRFLSIWLVLLQQPVIADQEAERIVSLDLCTDWMLFKYAAPSLQVTYSPLLYRYPLEWIPAGLPVHNGSLEQILEINADLVITGEFNAMLLVKRLHQLDTRVEVLSLPFSLEAITGYLQRFSTIVKTEFPEGASFAIKSFERRNQRLLILGANGIAAGRGTLENDILEQAGWSNYVKTEGFVSLDLEMLVADPPDAMLHSKPLANSLANLFARHPALTEIMHDQLSTMSGYWRWQCPGPWSFQLVEELSQWKKR